MTGCKICTFLDTLVDDSAKSRLISVLGSETHSLQKTADVLETEGLSVNPNTVQKHRREKHAEKGPKTTAAVTKEEREKHLAGWEPYAEFTDKIGSALVKLPTPDATARDLLITAGFNPDEWQISGSINTRRWMRYDQEWLYYYKFDVIAGESPEVIEEHIQDLVKKIRARKTTARKKIGGDDAFVFAASDWQIGKAEGTDGTPQTVQRVKDSIEMAVQRVQELRKQGRKMPTLVFVGLGDLGEGTCGFYPNQQFLIDRTRRQQGQLNRELITEALDRLTPLFDRTVVAAVGGNHGENRSTKGKIVTDAGDNDDCAYFDAVREAFDRVGGHNIEWHIMDDELTMSVEAGGVKLGLTHGHLFQMGKGSTAQQKAHEWWRGQDFNFLALRDTRILLSAHFHHFSAMTYGSRTHLQTPAMDPGSKWFRETRGDDAPPGTLTFRLDASSPLGWDDLSILHP